LTLVECNDELQKAIFAGPIAREIGETESNQGFSIVPCHPGDIINCLEDDEDELISKDCDSWIDDGIINGTVEISYSGVWQLIQVGWCRSVPNNLACCLDGLSLNNVTVTLMGEDFNSICAGTGVDIDYTYACGGAGGVISDCAQFLADDDGTGSTKYAASAYVEAQLSLVVNV
jgi:hypothetical protein